MINKNDFVISKMSLTDITSVSKLEKEIFQDMSQNLNFASELDSKSSYYIVTKINNNVVAYAGLWNLYDHADIIEIAVKEDYRNIGIATKMIINLLNYCIDNELSKIFLEVRISNISAQSLYKKFGFDIISTRKKYYPDNNEDAIIMMKKLN